jgi:hypothetical protein
MFSIFLSGGSSLASALPFMESPWSDFVVTPPSLASVPAYEVFDPIGPPTSDVYLTEEQVSNVFRPAQSFPPSQPIAFGFNAPFQQTPQFPMAAPEFSEVENRAIQIKNIDPQTTEDEIHEIFNAGTAARKVDLSGLPDGEVFIEYFDLRRAIEMKRSKNGEIVGSSQIAISFAPLAKIPDPKRPPNNGTIVVFNLQNGLTDEQIQSTFGHFGDIREIRVTPGKPTQRFIEYWDLRAAEKAVDGLNQKYVMGSKVSMEFSLPGGFRRNAQRPDGWRQPT